MEKTPKEKTEIKWTLFWMTMTSGKQEAYRMERFNTDKTAYDLYDWIEDKLSSASRHDSTPFIMTNCGIIR